MGTLTLMALVLAALTRYTDEGWSAPVQGTVVDAAGAPVAGAQVVAFVFGEEPTPVSLRTDANGMFGLAGPAFVFAAAEGHALGALPMGRDATTATVVLGTPRAITGQVTGPGEAPLRGATITLSSVDLPTTASGPRARATLPEALQTRYMARSGPDGSYRLAGIPQGQVTVRFSHPGYAGKDIDVAGGMLNVSLEKACMLRGRVVDGGTGVPGCIITAYPVPPLPDVVGRLNTTTDAEGRFALDGLPPRDYDVVAEIPENLERTAEAATVSLTAATEGEITFRAVGGGMLVIQAVDEVTGAPVAGAGIHVRGGNHPPRADDCRGWSTNGEGTFRTRVPEGRAVVEVGRPGERKPVEVSVREGEEKVVTVTCRQLAVLAGRLLYASGKPAGMGQVGVRTGRSRAFVATREDGSFRVEGLPTEEVEITASAGEEQVSVPVKVKPPFPAEVVVKLAPRPRVALLGRVVDERGRPVPDVEVHLVRQAGGAPPATPSQAATTDREGRYRFTISDLTAAYGVEVAAAYQAEGGESLGDTGSERRFTDLRVAALEAGVSGRVTDAQGQPVPDTLVFWPAGGEAYRVRTDTGGRFRLLRLPNRPVALVARSREGLAAFAQATPGKEAVLVLKE